MVWGDLKQHGWQTINLYERSNLILEVEGGELGGTAVIEPESVMATLLTKKATFLSSVTIGWRRVGKVSIGVQ